MLRPSGWPLQMLRYQHLALCSQSRERLCNANARCSYWIPGAYAPPWSEKQDPFLRPVKKKGFPQKIMTKVGVYNLGTSTTLESNKSPPPLCHHAGLFMAIVP